MSDPRVGAGVLPFHVFTMDGPNGLWPRLFLGTKVLSRAIETPGHGAKPRAIRPLVAEVEAKKNRRVGPCRRDE